MTIALGPNVIPEGTRPGSPIEVVDTFVTDGQTLGSVGIPISGKARAGDFLVAFMGFSNNSNTSGVGPFTTNPAGFLSFQTSNLSWDTGYNVSTTLAYWSRVLKATDIGKTVGLTWTESVFQSWGLIVYVLRNVNTASPIGPGGISFSGVTASTGNIDTGTGAVTADTNGSLILAAMAVRAGVAVSPGPLPAWFDTVSAGTNQPAFGMTSGIMDVPITAAWEGAGCQWLAGSTVEIVIFNGFAQCIRPMPAPGAPTLTLTPSGTSIDAAGQGGTLLKATIAYTPVSGQGQLDAWYLGRQPAAGGAVQWWNAAANQWMTSEFANLDTPVVDPVSGANTFTYWLPASAFADDGTNWTVAAFVREDNLGYKSSSSATQTFTADPPPVVTGVSVTNPNSATPTIGWTESITRPASAQTQYRARLFALATTLAPGFDPATSTTVYASGLVTSAALSQITTALAGGQDLVPYVQIVQTGGQVSAWKAGPVFFNNQGAALPIPSVTASPSTDLVTGAPRVALALAGAAPTALVEYSDDQATWYTVRDQHTGQLATAVALTGSPTIYDGEAPPGVDRFYRATGYSTAGAYPRSDHGVALLTPADSDFETWSGNWAPHAGATVAQSAAQAFSGTHSLAATFAAGSGSWVETPAGVAGIPVIPGQVVNLGGRVRAATAARHVTLGIDWAKADGTANGSTSLPAVLDSTTAWTLYPVQPVTVPAGSATCSVYFDNETDAAPGAETHYLDLVAFTSASTAARAPLGQFWLRRPLTGDSMLVKVTGDKIVEKMHEDATRYSIGARKNAVWVREAPVHGVTLKFSLYFTDQGSSDKFDAMRDAQETLLLQSDTSGKQWYIALPPEPERALRLTGSRLAGKPIRDLDLEVDEQDRP